MLWCATAPWFLAAVLRGQDLDLPRIAEIVQAYDDSIETLRIRTHTVWPSDTARKADPSLFGPGVILVQEFARAQGVRRHVTYTQTDGIDSNREQYYNVGEDSYFIREGDTTEAPAARINRADNPVRPTILQGLYGRDGQPLHALLRGPNARSVGRKNVDGLSCYEVEVMEPPYKVVWYIDPEHDLLCRKKVYFTPDGSLDTSWKVLEFKRIPNRWFPHKVIHEAFIMAGGRKISHVSNTEVDELHINEPIDQKLFQPIIPDGAAVEDSRGREPRNYIQGGEEARKRIINRRKAAAEDGEGNSGRRIAVKGQGNWMPWVAGGMALVSCTILIYAAKLRLARR